MPIGKPAEQRGFTYLLLLFALAIGGAGLAALGTAWSTAAQRAREAELQFRGAEFSRALASYQRSTPAGMPPYPSSLAELVEDTRSPGVRRHLRRLYADPFTGAADWQLLLAGERIRGVHSRSQARLFRLPPGMPADAQPHAADLQFTAAGAGPAAALPPLATPIHTPTPAPMPSSADRAASRSLVTPSSTHP